MRVLVISHNAFDKSNNMGRTLEHQFSNFSTEEIAQLYFVKSTPDSAHCKDFFCIPDSQVWKSIFTRKGAGSEYVCGDEEKGVRREGSIETAIRKKAIHRSYIFLLRNAIWSLGKWKTEALDRWLDKIDPDVIYYASGDYSFSYKLTAYIAKKRDIPVVIGCYDDFYIGKRKTWNPLYHLVYADLVKQARKLFSKASLFTAMSEMMKKDYEALFQKPGYTMYMPSRIVPVLPGEVRENRMIYAGTLDLGRAEQLAVLGRAVKSLDRQDITHIDVYSGELRKELTGLMSEENGIVFHGRISPDAVQDLMRRSKYVIHTESFREKYKQRVKYSVSTKIADCLSCGACIVAFGPADLASIDYLRRFDAAWIITQQEAAAKRLAELFENPRVQELLPANAKALAARNHDSVKSCEAFQSLIFGAAKTGQI